MSDASEYKDFYETVSEWIVRDYRNPHIKAEVILDTLLGPFVGDIVGQKNGCKAPPQLLMKEFPIRRCIKAAETREYLFSDDSLRAAEVDYLLGDKEKLYLVELKTEKKSFDDMVQPLRMIRAVHAGPAAVFDFYFAVRNEKTQRQKKKWQYCEFLKAAGIPGSPDTEQSAWDQRETYDRMIREKYKHHEIEVVYLTLDGVATGEKECSATDKNGAPLFDVVFHKLSAGDDEWRFDYATWAPTSERVTKAVPICRIMRDKFCPPLEKATQWRLVNEVLRKCLLNI